MKACCVPGRAAAPEVAGPLALQVERQVPSQMPGQAAAREAGLPRGGSGASGPHPGAAFVELPGGVFLMGAEQGEGFPADGEGPPREVRVSPFRIAATTVTNAQFAAFVRATGYITQAEEAGSSFVFYLQVPPALRQAIRQHPRGLPWWLELGDACWQRPEGPGSQVRDRPDHPVVHVSWHDAQAYCRWAGVSLPTEAQWEYAARGGLQGRRYPWGDAMPDDPPCNIWRGEFPHAPAAGRTPGPVAAGRHPPNGFGLDAMAGNVWEWCEDWFTPAYHQASASTDPLIVEPTGRRSTRGGSFLCHDSYCNRYRVAARGSNTPESSASNLGFRVAVR